MNGNARFRVYASDPQKRQSHKRYKFPYSACGFVVDSRKIRIVRTRTVSPFRTDNPNDTIFYAADAKTLAALGQRRGGVYPHPRCCGAFAFYLVRCW